MDKEKLGAKRQSFNVDIRRKHHQKMLVDRRNRLEVDSMNRLLGDLAERIRREAGQQLEQTLFELANVLGEEDLFGGMKSQPERIQQWCQELLELLVKVALNSQSLRAVHLALIGLSNLTGDSNLNDLRALKELVMFVEEIMRVRTRITDGEMEQIQWIYSNVLLKHPTFTEEELASVLSVLGDTSIYAVEKDQEKLRQSVVCSYYSFLSSHPQVLQSHWQYVKDISARLMELLCLEDRLASLEIVRLYRWLVSYNPQLLSARSQQNLLMKCMHLLSSPNSQLKQEVFRLMVCVCSDESASRFMLSHYSEQLVKLLMVQEKRTKELILDLLNEIVELQNGDDVARKLLQRAGLCEALKRSLSCHCFDVATRSLDLLIRCAYYSNDQPSNIALIKRYLGLGLPAALEKLLKEYPDRPNCEQSIALRDKCQQLLEWMRNVEDSEQ